MWIFCDSWQFPVKRIFHHILSLFISYMTFNFHHADTFENERKNSPVEDSRLFKHISKVDVSIEKVGIKCDGLLKMMNRKPDLTLCVKHTAEIAPGDSEVRTSLDCFKIARLNDDGEEIRILENDGKHLQDGSESLEQWSE